MRGQTGKLIKLDRKIIANINEIIPVSYTHLRAHETVLDIVCRLLLEKKKHTKKNLVHTMIHTNEKQYIDNKSVLL